MGSTGSSDSSSSEGAGGLRPRDSRERVSVHEPVLLEETLGVLGLGPGMTVVDGTIGAGGHARAVAEAIDPGGTLVGLDRDAEILIRARERLAAWARDSRARVGVRFFPLPFSRMREALEAAGKPQADAVLLDLGVSSLQLDRPERGFSFMRDGPLDMRMEVGRGQTAADWLARADVSEIERVLREYGEERHARRIAQAIVRERCRAPLLRTLQLADLVARVVPGGGRGRIHPATRTFQALRMLVNDEPGELRRGLQAAYECLTPGGRLAVISFHSIEDRLVKRFMRERMQPLSPKPVIPGPAERRRNPRSRSAKLRCAVKPAT